jgi:glycosyltransferase involved in cell wall biosynthesis
VSLRPLISVVIPAYNGERFLGQAIETALEQEYDPLEVIVVDDGSEDGTAEVAQSHPVRYLWQPNAGVAAARNTGIAAAQGELIAPLDQDDLWDPSKLSRQAQVLEERPELGYVDCRMRWFLEPGTPMPAWAEPEVFEQGGAAFVTSSMLARRSAFETVGLFDTSYVIGSDTDWFMRARDAGLPSFVIDEVLVRHRLHGANATYEVWRMKPELTRALRESIRRRRVHGR